MWPSIISALGGVFSSALRSQSVEQANRRNQANYNRLLSYNSPASQMARLSAAGINPNAVASQIASDNTAPAAPEWIADDSASMLASSLAQAGSMAIDSARQKQEKQESASRIALNRINEQNEQVRNRILRITRRIEKNNEKVSEYVENVERYKRDLAIGNGFNGTYDEVTENGVSRFGGFDSNVGSLFRQDYLSRLEDNLKGLELSLKFKYKDGQYNELLETYKNNVFIDLLTSRVLKQLGLEGNSEAALRVHLMAADYVMKQKDLQNYDIKLWAPVLEAGVTSISTLLKAIGRK